MKELAEQAMRDGACGMATGLIYTPGTFSKTDELVAVAEVVGKHGGIYACLLRALAAGFSESHSSEAGDVRGSGALSTSVSVGSICAIGRLWSFGKGIILPICPRLGFCGTPMPYFPSLRILRILFAGTTCVPERASTFLQPPAPAMTHTSLSRASRG